jgi:hypothetical protein
LDILKVCEMTLRHNRVIYSLEVRRVRGHGPVGGAMKIGRQGTLGAPNLRSLYVHQHGARGTGSGSSQPNGSLDFTPEHCRVPVKQ